MKRTIFLIVLILATVSANANAATYYAKNVTGTWAAKTSWSTTGSGGADNAGPPVAGDDVIFDSGFTGTITLGAAAACATITVQAGATGTLALSLYTLTVTGNMGFVSGFNVTASTGYVAMTTAGATFTGGSITNFPKITITANVTLNANGTTIATIYHSGGAHTITLGSALQCTVMDISQNFGATTFAGAYDMTIGSLYMGGSADMSTTFVANTTVTVNTRLQVNKTATYTHTVTAASPGFTLHNDGQSAVFGAKFTNVTATHTIYNWYGDTLTNTTGITNVTSVDIGGGAFTHAVGF
ncbi:MAG: hypothetical protein LLG97_19400 [Deltaproteobacteria bacterium]|nr:hypothetical protein [Deltaproteobacteria bacterium]